MLGRCREMEGMIGWQSKEGTRFSWVKPNGITFWSNYGVYFKDNAESPW